MKKLTYLIVGILLISSIAVISIGKEAEANSTQETVFSISEPMITEKDEFIKIDIAEANSKLMEEGKPVLPVITKTFTYPMGTIIKDVEVQYETYQKVLDKKIQPSPKPMPLTNIDMDAVSVKPAMNQEIYQSMELYPEQPISISKRVGVMYGENVMVLNVKVTPQYSPANDMITLPTGEIKIDVKYEEPKNEPAANDNYDMVIITTNKFADKLQPLVNHKIDMGINTVVKTVEDIYSEYPDGRDDAEKVKLYIFDMKETNDIKYVLLAGGRKGQTLDWHVPVRTTHNDDGWEAGYDSDLYYGDVYKYDDVQGFIFEDWDTNDDGTIGEFSRFGNGDKPDYLPDVSVGRIPFRYAFEVQPMIDKIIEYETQNDDSWFKKAIVISGDTFPPSRGGNPGWWEGEMETGVTVGLLEPLGFEMNKLWLSIPGAWTGVQDVLNAIDEGAGFIHFAGHSNPSSWGNHPPDDEDHVFIDGITIFEMPKMNNEGQYPIVVLGGCHSSQFNVTLAHIFTDIAKYGLQKYVQSRFYYMEWVPRDMSSMFVLKPNGGAIATTGNTGLGYGYVNENALEGLGGWIEPRFFKEYAEFEIDVLGEAHDQAITDYINIIGNIHSDQIDRKTIEEWVLLGDPSLKIGGY